MRADELRVIVLSRVVYPMHGHGGLQRHVYDLVRHLLGRGVRVTLITPPATEGHSGGMPEIRDVIRDERLTAHVVPYRTFPFAGRRGTTILDRITAYPIFGWRAGRLAYRLVGQNGTHIVHGLGASALGYAVARSHRLPGTVPFVFNPQGLEEFGATDPARAPVKRLAYQPLQAAVRACGRAADRVVATDEVLVPVVLRHLRVPPEKVRVVPNAVDLEVIDALDAGVVPHKLRRRAGIPDDDVLLLSVGRLESNKGFHVLVRALARLASDWRGAPQWRLVVIGDGPRRHLLQRQVQDAGLGDRVHLLGRAPDEVVHAWFAAATLFVHPTLYEGSSLVTLEAMARRRAVVATTAGGIPDKVIPGVTGWLVAPGDAEALAAGLRSALSDRSRLAAMGKAGRAVVERQFSWTAVTDRLLDLYDEILAQP